MRLGDYVKKGQVLLSIHSADLAGAFSDYQKAAADERLAKTGLDRAQLLYSHGALAEKDLQQAQDTEEKAQVDVQNADQHVRILGGDPAHPGSLIELRAPVSGTIVEQNISGFEGIKSLDNSPNLFTIADLSQVWVLCDVYENDLGDVHLGDAAEIRLNAYPDKTYHGKVADISRVLDPNTRSAKVRIVLAEWRWVLASRHVCRGHIPFAQVAVPHRGSCHCGHPAARQRLGVPERRRRSSFAGSKFTPREEASDRMQQIQDGLKPGEQIVANALEFSSAVAEQGK